MMLTGPTWPLENPLAYGNQAQVYRQNAVLGASPVQLVVMLYDGAIRFMDEGKAAMVAGNHFKQNQQLQKAQRIIMELMSTLDMVKGGEISTNLLALYTYIIEQLLTANVEDTCEPIDRSIRIISDLRESWVEVEKMVKVPRATVVAEEATDTAMAA